MASGDADLEQVHTPENPAPPADGSAVRAGSTRLARLVLELAVAVAVMLLVRALVVQSFYVPSESMEPTVLPGDRVVVDKWNGNEELQRGDVVVFDGTVAFGGPDTATHVDDGVIGSVLTPISRAVGIDLGEKDYLKRIIGLPGDRVSCCAGDGRLTVNGEPVTETYLPTGTRPSELTFDVLVPEGRFWMMGDNRSSSADSRAHLGDPGGGMVDAQDVIGRATLRYWPLARWGGVGRSSTLTDLPDAGSSP